jgi:hypothetical protein
MISCFAIKICDLLERFIFYFTFSLNASKFQAIFLVNLYFILLHTFQNCSIRRPINNSIIVVPHSIIPLGLILNEGH